MITNNPAVHREYSGLIETVYLEGADLKDVLFFARDKIHLGHRLLTHPLSGSVKPGRTRYKSILITKGKDVLDYDSLRIIEESTTAANEQMKITENQDKCDRFSEDYQAIDLALTSSDMIERR